MRFFFICVVCDLREKKKVMLMLLFNRIYKHNITNLDENITERDLLEIFAEFGKITSIHITRDEDGKSKGYALVQYNSKRSAKQAIDNRNGIEIKGKKM